MLTTLFMIVGWKLVDINFTLKGNYPFNPVNFTDPRSISAIARDAYFPFHISKTTKMTKECDYERTPVAVVQKKMKIDDHRLQ